MYNQTVTLLYQLGRCVDLGLPAGVCSDVDSPPGLEGIAGSGGLGLYKAGSWQCVEPFRDRPVTGSHLFGSAVVYLGGGSRTYYSDFGRGH